MQLKDFIAASASLECCCLRIPYGTHFAHNRKPRHVRRPPDSPPPEPRPAQGTVLTLIPADVFPGATYSHIAGLALGRGRLARKLGLLGRARRA